jgi:hypothetical protein
LFIKKYSVEYKKIRTKKTKTYSEMKHFIWSPGLRRFQRSEHGSVSFFVR